MSEPVTTIDSRFSNPGAVATEWDETRRIIEKAELFWLTTVRADGRPHVTPLVAVWLDGAIHFSTGDTEQKAINLKQNPHVILTTGSNQWEEGLDVVIEGDAVRVTDNSELERIAQAWTSKWDGRWQYKVKNGTFAHSHESDETIFVFAVRPSKIFAFAKNKFGQTRHQF